MTKNEGAESSLVAIVTGAGSGVGRETARLLADAGYAVVLVARTESKLAETKQLILDEVNHPGELIVMPADVSVAAEAQRVVDETLARLGRIDTLANVAGSAPLQPLESIEDDTLDACLAVNLKAVVYLTRAVWPVFKRQGGGVVVNVSSMASIDPFPGFNIYAAAKAGVNLFTKATADEGKAIHVRAYAVAPGAIETPMLRAHFSPRTIPSDKALAPAIVAGVIRDLVTGKHIAENGTTIPLPSP